MNLVVGAAVALWGLAAGVGSLSDNSFLTHLATGRLILEGAIPTSDPYSFTAPGEPWVVQSWLASVFYAAVEDGFGLGGVRLAVGLTSAVLAALVWRLSRPAVGLVGRVVVAGVVLGIGTGLWSERPYLFGLVALALVLLAAEGGLHPAWLVPTMWLWGNVHGSFPLGLVALGAFALGHHLDGHHIDGHHIDGHHIDAARPRTELRALGWAGLGTVLIAVNPLGPRLLAFPTELLSRQDVLVNIVEWQPPTFSSVSEKLFLAQVALAVILLVRHPRFRVAVPLAVFTAAALLGSRNVGVAAVVLVPGLAVGLRGFGTIDGSRRGPLPGAALAAVAVLGLLVASGAGTGPHVRTDAYPADAVDWLEDEGVLGAETRLVTRDFAGNYLQLRYGTTVAVFIDDRYDMYPTAVVEDYVSLVRGEPEWHDILERYRADAVLWERDQPLGSLLVASPEWRIAYEDEEWLVACPVTSARC